MGGPCASVNPIVAVSVDVHGDRSQRVEVTVGHPDYVIRTLGLAIAGGHRIALVRRE